jgi:hypothetical protein
LSRFTHISLRFILIYLKLSSLNEELSYRARNVA